ncbi:MAG: endoribonuclease L-PSP [Kiritimatiellae bacterium]|nr:endoribonuclease L-PSP [Kiritimatiellia bacterium]
MKTSKRISGGLPRVIRMTEWSPASGVPACPDGVVFSQTGWAARETLLQSGTGAKGTPVPQLWLCGGKGEFPPVCQQLTLPPGTPVRLITRHGCSVGAVYEDADATYAFLTGILPVDPSRPPEVQTASVFEEIEAALADAGMAFSHVARTWLYMDRILDWYDPFNRARDAFFTSRKVYDGLVPASTGIGSANLCGTAIAANAIAVKPKRPGAVTVERVDSPLQCTAHAYGSSFSRAVEIGTAACRNLLISGTASIEPGGKTAYLDDPDRQLGLTLDVVEAILTSRGMGWSDTARGIMYLKEPSYLPLWQRHMRDRGLTDLPIITLQADICRDDLLVELELDTVKTKEGAGCGS